MSALPQWLRPPRNINAWRVIALALTASRAHAQGAGSTRPDPTNARAVVPAVMHVTIPLVRADTSDDARIPWKEANDEVRCIGGWRVYARESQPTPPAAAPARAPQPKTPPTSLPKTCSDHRNPTGVERKGGDHAR